MPEPEKEKLKGQLRHVISGIGGVLVGIGLVQADVINTILAHYDQYAGIIAYALAAWMSWRAKA